MDLERSYENIAIAANEGSGSRPDFRLHDTAKTLGEFLYERDAAPGQVDLQKRTCVRPLACRNRYR